MLGQREPEIYGTQTLADIEILCEEKAKTCELNIDFKQSNSEGEIVTWIQNSINNIDGFIINAAAYTHTSVAIHDAIKLLSVPVVEVHLSNPKEREKFRHLSYIEDLANIVIKGKGSQGYIGAIDFLSKELGTK